MGWRYGLVVMAVAAAVGSTGCSDSESESASSSEGVAPETAGQRPAQASFSIIERPRRSAGASSQQSRDGTGRLIAGSHGKYQRAVLHSSEWCYEEPRECRAVSPDLVADPSPRRLPYHPGGVIYLETGKRARGISVTGFGVGRRVAARRYDGSGRIWSVGVPRRARGKRQLFLTVDYRYWKDDKRYGGTYDFFLFIRRHTHGKSPLATLSSHGTTIQPSLIGHCTPPTKRYPCALPDPFISSDPLTVHAGGRVVIDTDHRASEVELYLCGAWRRPVKHAARLWAARLPDDLPRRKTCRYNELVIDYADGRWMGETAAYTFSGQRHRH